MARIRTIKPEFWLNEDLALLSPESRLLAIGLLNHSDDEGFFKAHPSLVKAAVFPFTEDSVSIQSMIENLINVEYIKLWNGSDGKSYGQVVNFLSHQKINRPSASKIKDLIDFNDDSLNIHGAITTGKEQGKERNREQGTGKDTCPAQDAEPVKEVFEYWQAVMNKHKQSLTPERKAKIKARLKNYSAQDIKQAIDGCKATPHNMGQNDRNKPFNDIELICRNDTNLERFRDTIIEMSVIDQQPRKSIREMAQDYKPVDPDQCVNGHGDGLLIEHNQEV